MPYKKGIYSENYSFLIKSSFACFSPFFSRLLFRSIYVGLYCISPNKRKSVLWSRWLLKQPSQLTWLLLTTFSLDFMLSHFFVLLLLLEGSFGSYPFSLNLNTTGFLIWPALLSETTALRPPWFILARIELLMGSAEDFGTTGGFLFYVGAWTELAAAFSSFCFASLDEEAAAGSLDVFAVEWVWPLLLLIFSAFLFGWLYFAFFCVEVIWTEFLGFSLSGLDILEVLRDELSASDCGFAFSATDFDAEFISPTLLPRAVLSTLGARADKESELWVLSTEAGGLSFAFMAGF